MEKLCRRCTKTYEGNVQFCAECGGALVEADAPVYMQQPVASSPLAQNIEKMSMWKIIIYSCITFGIYGLIWGNKFTKVVHILVGRKTTPDYLVVCVYSMITFGIYGLIFWCKLINSLNEAKDIRNMSGERISAVTNLLLMWIPFVNLYAFNKVISAFNEIVDYDLETH